MRSSDRSERPRRAHMRRARAVTEARARWRMSSAESVACGLGGATRDRAGFLSAVAAGTAVFCAEDRPRRARGDGGSAAAAAALSPSTDRGVRPLAARAALSAGRFVAFRTTTNVAAGCTRVQKWAEGGAGSCRGYAGAPIRARMLRAQSRGRAAPFLVLAASLLCGCGHPASVDECNTIIAKSAELELRAQNVSDPAVIAQRTEAVKAARGEELLKRCVGKRITDRAVACVARAQTPREVDKCLE